ncbi:hypothetical protein CBR_g3087 [Chara braunii]|uniref:Chromo domain-containing protein n=1 Tax=Chara braunii TaxID=69332 RepID=A0A388KF18_CHABU|nr:hypothetical protein CBR_g3087 [Chara braunii]|eukprot:GBG68543.1 hypothetical protein CBR_g3087 [Chara braunii]
MTVVVLVSNTTAGRVQYDDGRARACTLCVEHDPVVVFNTMTVVVIVSNTTEVAPPDPAVEFNGMTVALVVLKSTALNRRRAGGNVQQATVDRGHVHHGSTIAFNKQAVAHRNLQHDGGRWLWLNTFLKKRATLSKGYIMPEHGGTGLRRTSATYATMFGKLSSFVRDNEDSMPNDMRIKDGESRVVLRLLACYNKVDIYKLLKSQFDNLGVPSVSLQVFYNMWRTHFWHVKFHEVDQNFAKCEKFVEFKESIHFAKFVRVRDYFVSERDKHLDLQLQHRVAYETEITNRTLGDILRKIIRDDQQWDLHLAHEEITYNHAVSPATGMSPYYCDLGYHPRVPADFLRPSQMHPDTSCPLLDDWVAHMTSIMKTAHEHIAASQTRMAARANRSRMDHPFKVGDDVLIDALHLQLEGDTLHKFRRLFFGPCRILQAVGSDTASSPVSFRVKLPDYLRRARVHDVYHVSLLHPYRRPSEHFAGRPYERPPPIMVDGHEEFLVSDIIGRRVTDDNPPHVEYLVRWKGYPDEEATWEHLEHLQHTRMLVRAYDRARRAGFTAPPQPTDPPLPPSAEETAEVEPGPSEADLQQQPDASERPQRTRRHRARYDD